MKSIRYVDLEQSEIIHAFEYYDFPLFFISKSPSNELYLNYYVEENKKGTHKWLFSRITRRELRNLIEQRISVLNILNHFYDKKRLYYLYVDSNQKQINEEATLEPIDSSNFDPDSFPEEDYYVEYDYVTNNKLVKVEQDLIDSSKFKMVLKDDINSHDIGLDLFLDILNNLKKSINDMAFNIGRKLIDQNYNHTINLRVDSLQPSSFGIYLKTEPLETDLFEVPERSLNNLFELIEGIQSKSLLELKEQIEIDEEYSLETIKSVKKMLKDIVENKFSLTLEGFTKIKKDPKEVKFTKKSYKKLDILDSILKDHSETYIEKINIEGTLTSINTKYNKFTISSTKNGEIRGKMSKFIFNKLKNENALQFRVPSKIKAVVKKEVIIDHQEDEHEEKYTLIQFEQPEK